MAQTHDAVVARIVAEEYLPRRLYIVASEEVHFPDNYAFASFDLAIRHYFQMIYNEFEPRRRDVRTPYDDAMITFRQEIIDRNVSPFIDDRWKQLFIVGLNIATHPKCCEYTNWLLARAKYLLLTYRQKK